MASQRTRLWINLGLLLIVAALLLLVVLKPGDEATDARLTTLDPNAIERIRVETGEQAPVELVRRDGRWMLIEPWPMPASPRRAKDLAAFAATRSFATYAVTDLDLARYELDSPRFRLWLDDTLIELGKTNPVNRQRYARVGDTVHLIDDTHSYILGATVPSYLGPDLLPPDAVVTRIELPGLMLARDASGAWQSAPVRDTATVQALVDAWASAQALWAKDFAGTLDAGSASIRITLADGDILSFTVASTDPDLVLVRPDLGVAYTLPAEAGAALLPAP